MIGTRFGMVAPAERLAALRVVVAGFVTVYLFVRAPAFLSIVDNAASRFDPVGVIGVLDEPVDGGLFVLVFGATLAAGVAATIGWRYRFTGAAFAAGVLLVTSYRSSWGQILWFEILMVLHLLVVGLAPAADAISLDDRRLGRPDVRAGPRYGWPILLVSITTVVTYLVAGIAKFRYGGTEWVDGDVLRNHVAFSAARLEVLGASSSPLAEPFLRAPIIASIFALGAVALELFAPVALLGSRIAAVWATATWAMHVIIALTMFVVFPYPLVGVAFASFFAIDGLHAKITGG